MNNYLSNKLKFFSFYCMVLVVLIHSWNIKQVEGYNGFIQLLVSDGFARTAVPIFFACSGYLFFLGLKPDRQSFLDKYQRRSKTLLIPFLLWSVWGLIFFFTLQQIPMARPFFNGQLIEDYSLADFLVAVFLKPVTYQLWFLQNLMLVVLLSPVLFFLIKRLKLLFLTLLLILWLRDSDPIMFLSETVLFFSLGGYFAIFDVPLTVKRLDVAYLLISFWVVLVVGKTALEYYSYSFEIIRLLKKLSILTGVAGLWLIFDRYFLPGGKQLPGGRFFSFSFFLYAFHEPVLTIFEKLSLFILGSTQVAHLITYVLVPMITISISLLGAHFLSKLFPTFYKLITGGR